MVFVVNSLFLGDLQILSMIMKKITQDVQGLNDKIRRKIKMGGYNQINDNLTRIIIKFL